MKKIRFLALALTVALLVGLLAAAPVSAAATPSLAAAQLVLESSIGINFYANPDSVAQLSESWLEIAFDNDRDGVAETVKVAPTPAEIPSSNGAVNTLCYYFGGITPDNMGTVITARLFYKSNGVVTEGTGTSYSVQQYILSMYGKSPALDRLLTEVVAYGKASETYTGKPSLDWTNATLSKLLAQASSSTVANTASSNRKVLMYSKKDGLSDDNAGIIFASIGLNLKDNAGLVYMFAPNEGKNATDYTMKLELDGVTYEKKVTASMYEEKYGLYVYRFRALGPQDMEKVVKAYFVDGDGKIASAYLRYSIDSYAYACYQKRTEKPALYNLTQTLIRYGQAVGKYLESENYLDIASLMSDAGLTINSDVSALFDKSATGYLINGDPTKPYLVNRDTLQFLQQHADRVIGTGSVKWTGFSSGVNSGSNPDKFNGVIPVSLLDEPIFLSTAMPSEALYFMSSEAYSAKESIRRINAGNMNVSSDTFHNLVGIGAVYVNLDATPLSKDQAVTVCLGKIQLLVHTDKDGWFLATEDLYPPTPRIYPLPWTGNMGNLSTTNYQTLRNNCMEIALTAGDYYGTADIYNDAKYANIDSACLHYWGHKAYFDHSNDAYNEKYGASFLDGLKGGEINGMIVAYQAWVKEKAASGKFVATVAADWRTGDDAQSAQQAFVSPAYTLTTTPRLCIGANLGPAAYQSLIADDPTALKTIYALLGIE